MELRIDPEGQVTSLYSEAIDRASLGEVSICGASHVEPNAQGQWLADLLPVGGPLLGPFCLRSEALSAEVAWLETHRIFRSELLKK